MHRIVLAAALALSAVSASPAEFNPFADRARASEPVGRVLVRLRTGSDGPEPAERVARLGTSSGVSLRFARSLTGDIHVAILLVAVDGERLAATLAALRADPAVEYADPDRRRHAHAGAPDDPLFGPSPGTATGQWYLGAPAPTAEGMSVAAVNALGAWSTTHGSAGIVIADLDTGVRFDHPDLLRAGSGGKLLPGYDFVGADGGGAGGGGSTFLSANDGDGWDADPSDPGDWLSSTDLTHSVFSDCTAENSSWHGTRTAGILGALTNNGTGIAGLAWNAWVLPVRVLGKCGGYDSDIIAGMLWAAGIAVAGAPPNPYPARIINMSLGSPGACGAQSGGYQDVIAQLNGRGVVVVISAGNEGGAVDEPADCAGAIAVTGVRHIGTKVGFANVGAEVALAAPAGNCVNTGTPCLFSIDTTTNLGTTVPGANSYTNQTNFNVGTSFSAPMVAGIAALMLSVNGNLSAAEVAARLKAGARPFPVIATDTAGAPIPMCKPATAGASEAIECNCTTSTCGAGLADAQNAVNEALRPIAAVAVPASTAPGQTVSLSAALSAAACNHSIVSYAWSILPGGQAGGTPALSAVTGPETSVVAPASGLIIVELVVTDDAGLTDTARTVVQPSRTTSTAAASAGASACPVAIVPATVTPPAAAGAPAGGGGGGGGALEPATLALLALTRLLRRRRGGAAGARSR